MCRLICLLSVFCVSMGLSAQTAGIPNQAVLLSKSTGQELPGSDATGVLSVSSDERLKNIVSSFDKGLDEILKLKPINYNWNNLSGLEQENIYSGFSAQNVKSVIPEAVGEDSRGFLTLSDRPIIAALVNSVNELKFKNDESIKELKFKYDELERENNELKAILRDVLKRLDELE